MVGKKTAALLTALVLTSAIFGGCSNTETTSVNGTKNEDKVFKIGITQIVEHPALDSAREGFVEALESKGFKDGEKIEIDFQNAQGDMQTAQTIAQNFVSEKQDMILAIATPTAQAAFNATKDTPILITAVTDPVKAGLVKSMDKSETNVTGTSDDVSIDKQFELLKKLLPESKTVGIIYNTSESNSELQVQNAKKAAPGFGLEIKTAGITNVNEIPQALSSLLGKIDILYIPTDNLVASAMPLISNNCYKNNTPIIGSEKAQVEAGALATTGIDYFELGFQTGLMAVEVLNGKSPKDIPLTTLKEMQLVINTDAAKKLKINIPEEISSKAEKVTGGVK
jgi:putative ABC transport system substrate-binding protein